MTRKELGLVIALGVLASPGLAFIGGFAWALLHAKPNPGVVIKYVEHAHPFASAAPATSKSNPSER